MKKTALFILTALLCACSIAVTNAVTLKELYRSVVSILNDESGDYEESRDNVISIVNYLQQWELIKEDYSLDISTDEQMKDTVKAEYYFFNDHISLVTGDSGTGKIILETDMELTEVAALEMSEGVDSEEKLETAQRYHIVDAVMENGRAVIPAAAFVPKYETTFYMIKITVEGKETYIRMKAVVHPGKVEVLGFQMNSSTAQGAVSEFMPSFRTVSRCSKLVTKTSDSGADNPQVIAVKNFGTIYGSYLAEDEDMILKESENVRYYQADEAGIFPNVPAGMDEESHYYALTLKFLNYNLKYMTADWKMRAYAVTCDGDVILGKNIETVTVNSIAQALYEGNLMNNETSHEFLYDNVLNPVTIENNGSQMANAMMKALNVRDTQTMEYALVNAVYQDMYRYIYFKSPYNDVKYHERGKFRAKSTVAYNGTSYDPEEKLLAMLNEKTATEHPSLSDWIVEETEKLEFQGFYKEKEFQKINYVKPEEVMNE